MKSLLVGVAGGSGSGKTTMAQILLNEFRDEAVLMSHDYYYKSFRNLTYEERTHLNFDHPESLETDLMVSHLRMLKNGEGIDRPSYNFVEHTRDEESVAVEPAKVIIVEGILIFENQDLCDLLDMRIFIDADQDIRIMRRIRRDMEERGRSLDSVMNQYISTVKPMHEAYCEPSKKNADIIVPGGADNPVAQQMIISRIKSILKHDFE